MPATRWQRARLRARSSAPWRKVWGSRRVRRHVQGVDLYLPWSHLLPDFARLRPSYGQNLVDLAEQLQAGRSDPLRVVDVGANIGDSALQIVHRTDARVLCVEGDPYWLDYLHRNTRGDARITVEEALLAPHEPDDRPAARPVRTGWTTKFVADAGDGDRLRYVSVATLRRQHPDFGSVRLIKSDTDGFDTTLAVAAAREWSESAPVLFFEYDPNLTREISDADPTKVWGDLAELGYATLAIWDNTGTELGRLMIEDAPEAARSLEAGVADLGYQFWDVAACTSADTPACAAFDRLTDRPYDVGGH